MAKKGQLVPTEAAMGTPATWAASWGGRAGDWGVPGAAEELAAVTLPFGAERPSYSPSHRSRAQSLCCT